MASPMKTRAPTRNRSFSRRAWVRTLAICVGPPRQSMRDMSLPNRSGWAIHPDARHSLALADARSLESLAVGHSERAAVQQIEEQYACDAAGVVTVTIRNLTSHYGRESRLGRWSGKTAVVVPSARKRSRKASS